MNCIQFGNINLIRTIIFLNFIKIFLKKKEIDLAFTSNSFLDNKISTIAKLLSSIAICKAVLLFVTNKNFIQQIWKRISLINIIDTIWANK